MKHNCVESAVKIFFIFVVLLTKLVLKNKEAVNEALLDVNKRSDAKAFSLCGC